jgi:hypothetical protein
MRPNYNKTTGQSYSAAEWRQLKSKCNEPGLNNSWSSTVLFDDEYYPDIYTMSGNITYTIDSTNAGTGNGRVDLVIGDGNTIDLSAFTIRESDLTPSSGVVTTVSGNIYKIVFLRRGSVSEVYLSDTGETEDITAPTITSIVVNQDNTEVTINISEAAYANNNGTGDLQVSDFTAELAGGTATSPVLSNPVHTAGNSQVTFDLSYTGDADGFEILTITVVDNSVYDAEGNVMASGQNGTDSLNQEGLLAHWDASDDSSVTTANGSVSSWADQTGTYTATQGTGAKQPTHSSANDVISFDSAVDQVLSIGDYAALEFQATDNYTVVVKDVSFDKAFSYVVANKGENLVNETGWAFLLSSGIIYWALHDGTTQNFAFDNNSGSLYDDSVARTFILTNESGILKIYNSSNVNIGTNGTTSITTADYTGISAVIGARSAGETVEAQLHDGGIGEIKIFNKALNSAERAAELGI